LGGSKKILLTGGAGFIGSHVVTNCLNNYGQHQFPEKLIPLFINNILNDKPLGSSVCGKYLIQRAKEF